MHSEVVSRTGFKESLAASFVFVCCRREFSLFAFLAIVDRFELECESKVLESIVNKSALVYFELFHFRNVNMINQV